jgi:hypothetical protein
VIGENPKLSDPDWNHLNRPLKSWISGGSGTVPVGNRPGGRRGFFRRSVAEKEGTLTNTERRCMRIHKAVEPIGNTLPDWEIISRLSTAMGYEMHYDNPEEPSSTKWRP